MQISTSQQIGDLNQQLNLQIEQQKQEIGEQKEEIKALTKRLNEITNARQSLDNNNFDNEKFPSKKSGKLILILIKLKFSLNDKIENLFEYCKAYSLLKDFPGRLLQGKGN